MDAAKIFIESTIQAFIPFIINETKDLFANCNAEIEHLLRKGMKEYLDKHLNRYSYVKTILHGAVPKYLYDIYVPLCLSCEGSEISSKTVKDIFDFHSYITIIGDAGSGKSTLIKHLFIDCLKSNFAIPINVELRYLNESSKSVEMYIKEDILENKLSANDSILERLLENGRFVFFLDGFDELTNNKRSFVIKSINDFINIYGKNYFIITSRPFSNIEGLPLFYNCHIDHLTTNDIWMFIDKQLTNDTELATKIKDAIQNNHHRYVREFLSNPLLLSLYILTFNNFAAVPNRRSMFYRRVVQTLFSEHDSKSKTAFVREKSSKLQQEEFEEILKRFSFLSFFENKFIFDLDYVNHKLSQIKSKKTSIKFDNSKLIEDLILNVALWTEDGGDYSFAHRSLQEYFAALFIVTLDKELKERAYKKAVESTEKMELFNLLSVCNEIDHLHYQKFFLIPMLTCVRNTMESLSALERTLYICNTSLKGVTFFLITEKKYYPGDNVILDLSGLSDFRQIVIEEIRKILQKNGLSGGVVLFRRRFLENPKIELYSSFLTDSTFLQLGTRFLAEIDKKVLEINHEIQNILETDSNIIDLI